VQASNMIGEDRVGETNLKISKNTGYVRSGVSTSMVTDGGGEGGLDTDIYIHDLQGKRN